MHSVFIRLQKNRTIWALKDSGEVWGFKSQLNSDCTDQGREKRKDEHSKAEVGIEVLCFVFLSRLQWQEACTDCSKRTS